MPKQVEMEYIGPGTIPKPIKVEEGLEVESLEATGLWKKASKSPKKKGDEAKEGGE